MSVISIAVGRQILGIVSSGRPESATTDHLRSTRAICPLFGLYAVDGVHCKLESMSRQSMSVRPRTIIDPVPRMARDQVDEDMTFPFETQVVPREAGGKANAFKSSSGDSILQIILSHLSSRPHGPEKATRMWTGPVAAYPTPLCVHHGPAGKTNARNLLQISVET